MYVDTASDCEASKEETLSDVSLIWRRYVAAFEKALTCKVVKRRYPTAAAYLKKIKTITPSDERASKELTAFKRFILANRPWPPSEASAYAQPAFESELEARVFLPNILTYHTDLPALQQTLTDLGLILFPNGVPDVTQNVADVKVVNYLETIMRDLSDISDLTGMSFHEIVRCPRVHQLAVKLAEDIRAGTVDHQQLAGVMLTMLEPLRAQALETPEVGLAIRMLTDLRDGRAANMASVAPLLHALTN